MRRSPQRDLRRRISVMVSNVTQFPILRRCACPSSFRGKAAADSDDGQESGRLRVGMGDLGRISPTGCGGRGIPGVYICVLTGVAMVHASTSSEAGASYGRCRQHLICPLDSPGSGKSLEPLRGPSTQQGATPFADTDDFPGTLSDHANVVRWSG